MSDAIIGRHGNWEYTKIEGKEWKRREVTPQWLQLECSSAEPPPVVLQLVRENQAPGEPDHWSLFLCREGLPGTTFQVRGHATARYHFHIAGTDILSSDSYKDSYIIAQPTEGQAKRVRFWADDEVPPSAPDQASVKENCQEWTMRVIGRPVAEGIVRQKWQDLAEGIKQSIR